MTEGENRAIRISLLTSIVLHAVIVFSYVDISSERRHERRIEVEIREVKEMKKLREIKKEEIKPPDLPKPERLERPTPDRNPIEEAVHQKVECRGHPRGVVEPIEETGYRPLPIASLTSPLPQHYSLNSKNSVESKGDPILYYQRLIKQKIEEKKRYPLFAKDKGIEGMVCLNFVILRNGRLKDIKVVKSCSRGILNKAAIESIKEANPFPPFPEEVNETSLTMNMCLSFELTHKDKGGR